MRHLRVFPLEGLDKTKGDAKILEDILRVFAKTNKETLDTTMEEMQDKPTEEAYYWVLCKFVAWCAELPQPVNVALKKLTPTSLPPHGRTPEKS